ncbi:hypothetical protein MOVI109754_01185 [Moritella viscosa]
MGFSMFNYRIKDKEESNEPGSKNYSLQLSKQQ